MKRKSKSRKSVFKATAASKNAVSLKKFVATERQKVFVVEKEIQSGVSSDVVYFGNNDESDTMEISAVYNTLGLSASDGTVYQNLYDSSEVYFKSAIYAKSKVVRTGTTHDFQNITNHRLSSQLCGVLQLDNVIYALEPESKFGHYQIDVDPYGYLSANNGELSIPNSPISTYTYDRDYIQECLESDSEIDSDKAVSSVYDFVDYNMIYEIPGTIQNDYQSGNIVANTFKGKNQYNSVYDMDHDDDYVLKNCRQYVGIDKCGGQLYLKYYDRYHYAADGTKIDLEKNSFGTKMQNIEQIGSVNRYSRINGHKASLYSIIVKTDIVKEALRSVKPVSIKNQIMNNINKEIGNVSRKIAESLQPAHVQLLSVYVQES